MLEFTATERKLEKNDLIVSKTNLQGHISYINHVFTRISDYRLDEVLGKPHSLIRHELMPRCVFQLLWEHLHDGREIFAYVVNRTKTDDYYWVFAHVTPSRNAAGEITSYHSNRRAPSPGAIEKISALYDILLREEKSHSNRKQGQQAGYAKLQEILKEKGVDYDEFVLSL